MLCHTTPLFALFLVSSFLFTRFTIMACTFFLFSASLLYENTNTSTHNTIVCACALAQTQKCILGRQFYSLSPCFSVSSCLYIYIYIYLLFFFYSTPFFSFFFLYCVICLLATWIVFPVAWAVTFLANSS